MKRHGSGLKSVPVILGSPRRSTDIRGSSVGFAMVRRSRRRSVAIWQTMERTRLVPEKSQKERRACRARLEIVVAVRARPTLYAMNRHRTDACCATDLRKREDSCRSLVRKRLSEDCVKRFGVGQFADRGDATDEARRRPATSSYNFLFRFILFYFSLHSARPLTRRHVLCYA